MIDTEVSLVQIDCKQTVQSEGKITNRVKGGSISQKNIVESVKDGGKIIKDIN